jgi:signal transduction histidine kinase
MNARNTLNQIILPPLIVMLLLTLLVGITAFQLTDTWRHSAQNTVRDAVHAVVLTNIRWELSQAESVLKTNPEETRQRWQEARQQVNMLAETSPNSPELLLLKNFIANDRNIHNIRSLLKQPFLSPKLAETRRELEELQQYSRFVTAAVTVSMLFLGTLLTAITAKDLTRLVKALIQSRDLNTKIQEEERRRIAQDLHDGVIQEMIDLKRHYSEGKVDHIITSLRRVCHNLKPQVLDDLGLPAALEFLADDLRETGLTSVQMTVDTEGLGRLPKDYELPLFRVIQELLTNIKHHAEATQATLTVAYDPSESPMLSGYVTDNGKGFEPKATTSKHMGLTGVQERVQQLGGRLNIESKPGQGSRFQFFIPVRSQPHG